MTWLEAHWQKLAVALACIFALTTLKGCADNASLSAKLAACEAKPPVIQTQTVTVKEKCAGVAEVRHQAGSPCPDVRLTLDGDSETAVSQTQTAQAGTQTKPQDFGLWLGAGYLSQPFVSAGIQWKAVELEAKRGPLEWGGGLRYRLVSF